MSTPVTDDLGRSMDPVADPPERAAFRAALSDLISAESPRERVLAFDRERRFDDDLRTALATMGVFGLGADPAAGGAGTLLDQLVAIEELAAGPTSTAVHLIVQYMGSHLLSTHGLTDAHRSLLSGVITGSMEVSFALTEASGGTDVARSMGTRARRTSAGWQITGEKMWISGADRADALIVLARTSDADSSSIDGITMFVVPAATPGVDIRTLDTMAIHSYGTCAVTLDATVPNDAVLGSVDHGFRQVLETLNRERLGAAAGALGAGRAALEAAVGYARERTAFDRPLGGFQVLQHRLVDGGIALQAARSLTMRAAEVEQAGGRADLLTSMAKIAATEAATRITQDGMQLFGAAGFSTEVPMQQWFRDVRLWTFSPLTNEMLRNYLGERWLGLPRSF